MVIYVSLLEFPSNRSLRELPSTVDDSY